MLTLLQLFRPRIVDHSELDEQAELVGADPLSDDLVTLEMHDGDHPFVHCLSCRSPSRISTCVGAPEGGPDHDGIGGDQYLVDLNGKIWERAVVEADGLDPGRRSDPESVDVGVGVQTVADS
jgi:hypothetical protein